MLDKARYCLLDFLACALATQDLPWVKQARDVAVGNSATPNGLAIIGTTHRVSLQDAAFANAVAGHSLVRDDMHLGSVSHLGVVVVPAALALAPSLKPSGREFLAALACGYEAGGRLGSLLMDVDTAKKVRPTGLIGAFAAAATGARLAGLDETRTGNALGFAANYITGLNEWAAWGSDDMYFHPGIAARNGITAMQLARAGARAASGALDGAAGLFAALGKTVPASPALPFTAEPEINRVFFKQVPACNYAQTAAQAALAVRREKSFHADRIDTVAIRVPHAAAHYPGCDYAGPFSSILQARMSIHFNVASALLHGDVEDSHYRDYTAGDIAALAKRVTVSVDDSLSAAYPARQGAVITVTSGRDVLTAALDDVLAASPDDVTARFVEAAQASLGEKPAQALLETVMAMASLADAGELDVLLST